MSEAGVVKIIFAADATSYSAALTAMQKQMDSFAAKAGIAGRRGAAAGHKMVAPWQASSAALRVAEGNMANNIRAAERFLATIPGVGRALQAAFPVVGAIALLGVFGRMTTEMGKFIKESRKLPQAIANGFREVNLSSRLELDELTKSNDALQNQLDKLQGIPQNNLARAIDDARIASDKLEQSLARSNQQLAQMMQQHEVGWRQGLVTGQYQTTGTEGSINYWNQELSSRALTYNDAVHQYGPNSGQAQAAMAQLEKRRQDAEAWARRRIAVVSAWPDRQGATSNVEMAQGFLFQMRLQDDLQSARDRQQRLQPKVDALTHARELQASQREAATRWLEQQKRSLESEKSLHDMTLGDEANWWIARAATERHGAEAFRAAIAQANQLIAQQRSEHVRETERWSQQTSRSFPVQDLSRGDSYDRAQGGQAVGYLRSLDMGLSIQQRNAQAFAQTSLAIAVARGQMSQYDAIQVTAAMHAGEFGSQMKLLRDAMASVQAATWLSPIERAQQMQSLRNRQMRLSGEFAVQSQQDNAAAQAATSLGALRDSSDQLTQAFLASTMRMGDVLARGFGDINREAMNNLSIRNYRSNWGGVGADMARGVGTMAMQRGEGEVMRLLGFGGRGQLGASEANAMWVRFSSVGGAAAGAAPKLATMISSGAVTPGSTSGLMKSAAQIALHAIPGFATGGTIPSGMPAIVGEAGPELLPPVGHPRTVVPNGQWGLGGGHTFNIDARGATDPAATAFQIQRAMHEVLQQVPAISLAAHKAYNRNRPGSSRL